MAVLEDWKLEKTETDFHGKSKQYDKNLTQRSGYRFGSSLTNIYVKTLRIKIDEENIIREYFKILNFVVRSYCNEIGNEKKKLFDITQSLI